MNWKIYYSDGSTFSSDQGEPWDAPGLGVIVIVVADREHGRKLCSGYDYYIWKKDDWFGVDYFGLFDYLFAIPGQKNAVAGRTISNQEFQELYNRAYTDPDFAPKTAHSYRERVVKND